jgi:hypothetical protein
MKATIKSVSQAWTVVRQKPKRAYRLEWLGVISSPLIVFGGCVLILTTPILNRISRRQFVLLYMPALGYDGLIFLTFMAERSPVRTISKRHMLYLAPKSARIDNRFLFEIWRRIALDTGDTLFRRVSPFTWSTHAWIANYPSVDGQ